MTPYTGIKNGWATGSMYCEKCGCGYLNVRFRYSCYDLVEGDWPVCCGSKTSFSGDWRPVNSNNSFTGANMSDDLLDQDPPKGKEAEWALMRLARKYGVKLEYSTWDELANAIASSLLPPSANDSQQGGDHYKNKPIQPWDYILSNDLGFCEGNAIKYVTRWKEKNGVEDLLKAKHYLEKLIEHTTNQNL